MGKIVDWKPWYRKKGYKGNLTEDQKRYLDSFRNGKPHPAVSFERLPEEVQDRIIELEMTVEEHQTNQSLLTIFAYIVVGCFFFYWGFNAASIFTASFYFIIGLLGLVKSYQQVRLYQATKGRLVWNGDTEKGEPFSSTDEEIQRHWEIRTAVNYARQTDG